MNTAATTRIKIVVTQGNCSKLSDLNNTRATKEARHHRPCQDRAVKFCCVMDARNLGKSQRTVQQMLKKPQRRGEGRRGGRHLDGRTRTGLKEFAAWLHHSPLLRTIAGCLSFVRLHKWMMRERSCGREVSSLVSSSSS